MSVKSKIGAMVTISKIDEENHMVIGPVYKPGILDTQGDWMSSTEIKKMAYGFMESMNLHEIDTNHNLVNVDAFVCESYIAKSSDPDGYPEGSWIVAVKINDDDTWQGILNGDYTGFSMYGQAFAIDGSEPESN